ncbi:MAG: hypothetical protein ACRDLS_15545, partial [Solirubrobacteraceae bacterium]
DLRDVTREFARGEAPLEALRGAARAERGDRRLADEILKLITEWESSAWSASAWSRNELRARAKSLVPPAPPASTSRQDPATSMYEAGLRGQRRRD